MRTEWIILIGVFALTWGQALSAAPIPTKPVFTNKTRFRIPYNYDAAEMQRLGAREIRLFVSVDRGLRWQPIQSVPPEAGKFSFQAPGDGEFWFSVRTVDAQNRLHPSDEAVEPGLQVIVDTTVPKLELVLRQTAPGRVQLAWTALDEYLDPSRLRLEFIQPGATDWQSVGVVPKAADQTEWSVPQGGTVAVRGSISDMAGNVGQGQTQLIVAGAGESVPRPATPTAREKVASQEFPGGSNAALTISDRFPSAAGVPREPAAQAGIPAVAGAVPRVAQGASVPPATAPGSFVSHRTEEFTGPTAPTTPVPRRDPRIRIVNGRQFQIGYKVQDVGPSGVGKIELYITQDDGRTWYRYGEDADRQSPFAVEVPAEGAYGFMIVVHSGAGLAADPPQPGEKPSIQVVVDETAPSAELLPLQQGRGLALNKILIEWKSRDANPAEMPISLFYAAQRNGPWQPIAAALENTGSYIWTVTGEVPSKFFVRLEVRDAAGNVQRLDTPEPVVVDFSKPSARIVDIEISNGAAGPN